MVEWTGLDKVSQTISIEEEVFNCIIDHPGKPGRGE